LLFNSGRDTRIPAWSRLVHRTGLGGVATGPRGTWSGSLSTGHRRSIGRRVHFSVACTPTDNESKHSDPKCSPQHDDTSA